MPWLFPAGGNLHPSRHSHTLGRKIHKGNHLSEKWMPCVYSQTPPPPRLALEMLPSLGYAALGCVAALRLHFMWIYMSRPGMINSHDFVVLLTRFESPVLPFTISMDFAYGQSLRTISMDSASLGFSLLTCKMNIRMLCVRMIARVQGCAVSGVAGTLSSRSFTLTECF